MKGEGRWTGILALLAVLWLSVVPIGTVFAEEAAAPPGQDIGSGPGPPPSAGSSPAEGEKPAETDAGGGVPPAAGEQPPASGPDGEPVVTTPAFPPQAIGEPVSLHLGIKLDVRGDEAGVHLQAMPQVPVDAWEAGAFTVTLDDGLSVPVASDRPDAAETLLTDLVPGEHRVTVRFRGIALSGGEPVIVDGNGTTVFRVPAPAPAAQVPQPPAAPVTPSVAPGDEPSPERLPPAAEPITDLLTYGGNLPGTSVPYPVGLLAGGGMMLAGVAGLIRLRRDMAGWVTGPGSALLAAEDPAFRFPVNAPVFAFRCSTRAGPLACRPPPPIG